VGLGAAGTPAWTAAVQRGLAAALDAHGAAVVGGNVARADGATWLSLTLLGEVERGRAWTRFGARPGDLLAVTGQPGRAGAAVRLGAGGRRVPFAAETLAALWRAHATPEPRLAFARALAAAGAVTAAVDLSDGVHGDLEHLCEASGVGAVIEEAEWPEDAVLDGAARLLAFQRRHGARWRGAARAWEAFRPTPAVHAREVRALRFGASDDYELLLAVDPAHRSASAVIAQQMGVPLAFVGTCTDAPGVRVLRHADGRTLPVPGTGWDHLAR
jgi:thiamine-monophosphate kinase